MVFKLKVQETSLAVTCQESKDNKLEKMHNQSPISLKNEHIKRTSCQIELFYSIWEVSKTARS